MAFTFEDLLKEGLPGVLDLGSSGDQSSPNTYVEREPPVDQSTQANAQNGVSNQTLILVGVGAMVLVLGVFVASRN